VPTSAGTGFLFFDLYFMENNSFVKLFRKIVDWEWYLDIPVKVLFIHLLINVNFTEKKWQGKEIKK
jgi:hypothetical protein